MQAMKVESVERIWHCSKNPFRPRSGGIAGGLSTSRRRLRYEAGQGFNSFCV